MKRILVLLLLAVPLSYSQTISIVSISKTDRASEETIYYENIVVSYLKEEIKKDPAIILLNYDDYGKNSIRIQLLTLKSSTTSFSTACVFVRPTEKGLDGYIDSMMLVTGDAQNCARLIFNSLSDAISRHNTASR